MTMPAHIVVLGGGLAGISSAWYLVQKGFRVTLVEQHEGSALETSFANGGLITPSMSDPWAAPGLPMKLLSWIGREDSPFLLRPSAIPRLAPWGLRFLRQCNDKDWQRNTQNTLRLCRYSHQSLRQLRDELAIAIEFNSEGTLHLFRDALSMESTQRAAEYIGKLGVEYKVLTPEECVTLEPSLAAQVNQISGGIHYADDEAGDAHQFTRKLARHCADRGVEFRYNETVESIEVETGAVVGVKTNQSDIAASGCLLALGNASSRLARPLGIKLPIYPVKGYSLSIPVNGWNGAPVLPFVDNGRKMAIVRFGNIVRVAGTAEFTGHDKTLSAERVANLESFFDSLFPDCPTRHEAVAWTGLRPTTPDNLPYIGESGINGLYLNTGHGHLGWTMSCGSARLVADVIAGEAPGISMSGLTLANRYG